MSVSNNFGNIFNSAVFGGIISAIVVFGVVLVFTYRSRMKRRSTNGDLLSKFDEKRNHKIFGFSFSDFHPVLYLSGFSEHGGLRIEYSIFLLTAGATQIAYSMLYTLLTITDQ